MSLLRWRSLVGDWECFVRAYFCLKWPVRTFNIQCRFEKVAPVTICHYFRQGRAFRATAYSENLVPTSLCWGWKSMGFVFIWFNVGLPRIKFGDHDVRYQGLPRERPIDRGTPMGFGLAEVVVATDSASGIRSNGRRF